MVFCISALEVSPSILTFYLYHKVVIPADEPTSSSGGLPGTIQPVQTVLKWSKGSVLLRCRWTGTAASAKTAVIVMGQEQQNMDRGRDKAFGWQFGWLEIDTVLGRGEAPKSRDLSALHNCQDCLRHMDWNMGWFMAQTAWKLHTSEAGMGSKSRNTEAAWTCDPLETFLSSNFPSSHLISIPLRGQAGAPTHSSHYIKQIVSIKGGTITTL